jgi:hypothetical protein
MTKKAVKKKQKATPNTKAARKAVKKLVAAGEQRRGSAAAGPTASKRSTKAAAQAADEPINANTAPINGSPVSKQRWKSVSDAALRALYAEKVGRPTDSNDRRYLILRIRAAEQGRIPVGPRAPRIRGPKTAVTILFADEVLAELDVTAKADGFEKRLRYLRTLLREALATRGHAAIAERLAA